MGADCAGMKKPKVPSAPTIKVLSVQIHSAIIKIVSDCSDKTIKDYKLETAEMDGMTFNYTPIFIENDIDENNNNNNNMNEIEYELKSLEESTKYYLRSCVRVGNEFEWSPFSTRISFETTSRGDIDMELLLTGYCRIIIIPDSILSILQKYIEFRMRARFHPKHEFINVSDDGLTASLPMKVTFSADTTYGTIRLNRYFRYHSSKDKSVVYLIRIKMSGSADYCSIGFATKGFRECTTGGYLGDVLGEDPTVFLGNNGGFSGNKHFKTDENYPSWFYVIEKNRGWYGGDYGDIVCVSVDMKNRIGQMWNENRKEETLFQVHLPNCVTVVVQMGEMDQSISIM